MLILAVFQTYLPEELDARLAYPGYAITAFSAAKLLLHTPAGVAADRLGRRVALLIGIGGCLPALVLMLVVPNAEAFIAFAALYGVGIALVWPALYALLADMNPPERRGHALAVLNAGNLVGFGIGAMLGAIFTDYASARVAFLACLGLNVLAFAVAMRLPAPPATEVRRVRITSSLVQVLPVLRNGFVVALAGVIVMATLGTSMLAPVLRAYAVDTLDIEFSVFILYMFVPATLAAVSFVPAGTLADRFGRLRPLGAGLAVCGLSLGLMGFSVDPLPAAIGACGALVGYAMVQPSWAAALLDRVPGDFRATLMGAITGLIGVAGAAGPTLGATIGEEVGPEATFRLAGVLLLGAAGVVAAILAAGVREVSPTEVEPT
jgi:MFS family permease